MSVRTTDVRLVGLGAVYAVSNHQGRFNHPRLHIGCCNSSKRQRQGSRSFGAIRGAHLKRGDMRAVGRLGAFSVNAEEEMFHALKHQGPRDSVSKVMQLPLYRI